jgi:hypothetical protein
VSIIPVFFHPLLHEDLVEQRAFGVSHTILFVMLFTEFIIAKYVLQLPYMLEAKATDVFQQRNFTYADVSEGKVNILGGHSIDHPKQKNYVCTYVLCRTVFEIDLWIVSPTSSNVKMHSDEQHAISSHELQSALMLTVESKICKLYQLCYWNNKYRY